MQVTDCLLCETEGGVPVFRGDKFRVIRAEEADFPALYRLVWHVIARFDWGSHFPAPVWGAAVRSGDAAALARVRNQWPVLDEGIRHALAVMPVAL